MNKPWLNKSFLDIRKNTERDYPPKRKKPWLTGSFPEMEHFHERNYGPLQRGFNNQMSGPNPCGGHRSLNFDILPGSIDCDDGPQELLFILSDDFKCASITQLGGGGVTIDGDPIDYRAKNVTDTLVSNPDTSFIGGDVRNTVVGELDPDEVDSGIDSSIMCFAAEDTCCGGISIACIFTENCGASCDDCDCEDTGADCYADCCQWTESGTPEVMELNDTKQFTCSGGGEWSVTGTGATIDQTGLLSTDGSACGTATVSNSVCGSKEVRIQGNGSAWVPISEEGPFCTSCTFMNCTNTVIEISGMSRMEKVYWCSTSCSGEGCVPSGACTSPCVGTRWLNTIETSTWQCPP